MKPVYCKNCKFYDYFSTEWGSSEWCEHPDNVRTGHNHAGPTKQYLSEPKARNANANCKDYVYKPTKCNRVVTFVNYLLKRKYE